MMERAFEAIMSICGSRVEFELRVSLRTSGMETPVDFRLVDSVPYTL